MVPRRARCAGSLSGPPRATARARCAGSLSGPPRATARARCAGSLSGVEGWAGLSAVCLCVFLSQPFLFLFLTYRVEASGAAAGTIYLSIFDFDFDFSKGIVFSKKVVFFLSRNSGQPGPPLDAGQ